LTLENDLGLEVTLTKIKPLHLLTVHYLLFAYHPAKFNEIGFVVPGMVLMTIINALCLYALLKGFVMIMTLIENSRVCLLELMFLSVVSFIAQCKLN